MRDGKKREILFKNAPLQEVVAEVHWDLQPVTSLPGAAIDPFYDATLVNLTAAFTANGLPVLETTVPDNLPKEMFPHKTMKLFRRAPGAFPVYQFGPGVFTANNAAPYHGWKNFSAFLGAGLDQLERSHPNVDYLRVSQIILRYINIFTDGHGLGDANLFLRDHLGLNLHLPEAVTDSFAEDGQLFVASELRFPLKIEKNALGTISWKPVAIGENKVGLGLDFNVILNVEQESHKQIAKRTLEKINVAHDLICDWFKGIATGELWAQLEPEYEG